MMKPLLDNRLGEFLVDAIRPSRAPATPDAAAVGDGPLANIDTDLRLRVLLVEDNAVDREVAVGALESLGCLVATAENGREALHLLDGEAFDLVLMDCRMPKMDGYKATRLIREGERRSGDARIPIVALTSNKLEGDRQACLNAGMDEHLGKPFTVDELREVLERWSPSSGGGKARRCLDDPASGTDRP